MLHGCGFRRSYYRPVSGPKARPETGHGLPRKHFRATTEVGLTTTSTKPTAVPRHPTAPSCLAHAFSAEIDYGALTGLPDSAALEAGKHALAGAVPAKSEDGYAIATFAGGCFWGIELAYQVPQRKACW